MWKQPEVVWVISLEERRNVEKPSWNSSVFVHNHENVISKYNSAGRIYLSSTRGSDGSIISRRKFKNCLKREFIFFKTAAMWEKSQHSKRRKMSDLTPDLDTTWAKISIAHNYLHCVWIPNAALPKLEDLRAGENTFPVHQLFHGSEPDGWWMDRRHLFFSPHLHAGILCLHPTPSIFRPGHISIGPSKDDLMRGSASLTL